MQVPVNFVCVYTKFTSAYTVWVGKFYKRKKFIGANNASADKFTSENNASADKFYQKKKILV